MAEAVSTFISYSRTDTDFVDRLEADLRARGFKTWVDRRKLEGTREWQPQIDHAIAEYPLMIVVLSPDAVASPYVRHEYEYAHQLGKRIVTLLHKPNLPTVPPELAGIQWVDFVDKPYETSLVELIDGCQDSSFDQASDPRTLYNQAHDLESTDPERAAILYQRLINRAPTYAGGRAQVDLDRLNQQLYPQRVQRLRDQAETARKDGQYGAEAGALQALIALGGQDRNMLAWAEEYLPIAEQNSAWLDTYENVKHCVETGDKDRACELLAELWRKENAPFFRDPVSVAPALGLVVPMSYEQWKEERQADEERARRVRIADEEKVAAQKQAAREKREALNQRDPAKDNVGSEFESRIAQERERFMSLSKTISNLAYSSIWMDKGRRDSSRVELDSLERESVFNETLEGSNTKALPMEIVSRGLAAIAADEELERAKSAPQRPTGLISEEVFIRLFFTYMVFGFIGIFALFVPSFFIPSINATFGSPLNVLVFLGYIDLGFILVITVIALLVSCLRLLKSSTAARRYVRRVLDLETKRNALRKATESAARQWSSAYHAEYLARIRQIESERDSILVPFEEQRQQRMAEFEDEHKRKLDDIDSIHQRRITDIEDEYARTLAHIAARYAGI